MAALVDFNRIEYSLALIKPDGMNLNLQSLIVSKILSAGLEIIHKREIQITPKVMINTFPLYGDDADDYLKYMTSRTAYVILARGSNAHAQLLEIKYWIRRLYASKENENINIMHTADSGLEFFLQKQSLLYDLPTYQYTMYGNFFYQIPSRILSSSQNIYKFLLDIKTLTCVRVLGLISENTTPKSNLVQSCWKIAQDLGMMAFTPILYKCHIDKNELSILAFKPSDRKIDPVIFPPMTSLKDISSKLKDEGWFRVLVNLPQIQTNNYQLDKYLPYFDAIETSCTKLSINQARYYTEKAGEHGLSVIGGSKSNKDENSVYTVGACSISYKSTKNILDKMHVRLEE